MNEPECFRGSLAGSAFGATCVVLVWGWLWFAGIGP